MTICYVENIENDKLFSQFKNYSTGLNMSEFDLLFHLLKKVYDGPAVEIFKLTSNFFSTNDVWCQLQSHGSSEYITCGDQISVVETICKHDSTHFKKCFTILTK